MPNHNDPIAGIFEQIMGGGAENQPLKKPKQSPEIEARKLLDLHADLQKSHPFKEGDLITWKKGLKNGRYPYQDYAAIVTKVLDRPVMRSDVESGSNHFHEPLDLVILVDTDDEISEFHVDSRRFKPYDGDVV